VHSIVLQVPISQVSKNGNVPTTVDDPASVIVRTPAPAASG